jgi:hypothetical protein
MDGLIAGRDSEWRLQRCREIVGMTAQQNQIRIKEREREGSRLTSFKSISKVDESHTAIIFIMVLVQ